jgi:hypothetical protein
MHDSVVVQEKRHSLYCVSAYIEQQTKQRTRISTLLYSKKKGRYIYCKKAKMKHLMETINKAIANAAKHNRSITAYIKQIKKIPQAHQWTTKNKVCKQKTVHSFI